MAGLLKTRDVALPGLAALLGDLAHDAQPRELTFEKSMKESSVLLRSEAKDCFSGSHDPDGNPWAPLKRQRNRQRDRRAKGGSGQKPLVDRGILAASMSAAAAAGSIRDIGPMHLEQGSNLDYAGFQNDGTRFIPPRPFAGITDRALDKIELFVADDVVRQLGA